MQEVFDGVTQANTNPTLEKVDEIESPKRAAHDDAIYLNEKLFARVAAIYKQIDSLGLDAESRRLVEVYYKKFVHAGANLSAADKAKLKKLNEEESTLENSFRTKLLAATKEAAYSTTDKSALKGLSDAQLAAAAEAAKERKVEGYVLPLQNTTQQPVLVSLTDRATRQAVFEDSWNRAERGGANDTRETIARLAQAARGEGEAAGLSELRGVEPGRPDGEDAGGGAEVHGRAGAGVDGEGEGGGQGHSGADRRAEGRLPVAAVGLGVLLRAGAQGEVRPRRGAGEAVLRAEQCACRTASSTRRTSCTG